MSLSEVAGQATAEGISLGRLAIRLEAEETGESQESIVGKLREMLAVMASAITQGLSDPQRKSRSGLTGGDACRVMARLDTKANFPGNELLVRAMAYALAVAEVNACMGRVVAAPTAGSCGIVPGTLFALRDTLGLGEDHVLEALAAAGLVGQVIAEKATLSGAEGGCQAECGSAAAMAAAGMAQMGGGAPTDCIHAAALALKGLLGLVCDPVAGLVEVPCVKRNALCCAIALGAAEMALAGVRSFIPPDEVIEAMGLIGRALPESLRETSEGGLAVTDTARKLSG
ncbi:MAG: L-serine ammonia-lyase, iron-sulfur-dependent, subunit alpha [Bacillota bacterium]